MELLPLTVVTLVEPMMPMITITRTVVAQHTTAIDTADIGIADGIGRMEVKSSQVEATLLTPRHKTSYLPTVAILSLIKGMLKLN